MADVWISECMPCKWVQENVTQDAALKAAVTHRYSTHPDVSDIQAAQQGIAHVQFRAQNAIGVQEAPQLATSAAASTPPDSGTHSTTATAAGTEPATPPADTGTAPNQ